MVLSVHSRILYAVTVHHIYDTKKKINNTRISDKEVQKEKNIGHIEPDAPHTPSTTIIFMLYTKEMAFETTKSAGL